MEGKQYTIIVQVTRQLAIDVMNDFVQRGAQVTLVTGVVETNYMPLDDRIKIKRLNEYDNTTAFKRVATWTLFTIRSFFWLLSSRKSTELVIITTPPFMVFLGAIFRKWFGQKYHLIIWDLYPDVLVNFGVLSEKSWIIRWWKALNRRSFKSASNIFTLGKHLSDAIKAYTSKEPIIIPNWADTDFIQPMEKAANMFAQKHGLQDKLVVMYSGNLGLTHDIESIVATAKCLQGNKDIHFVIIGDGPKKAKIEQMVKGHRLSNLSMLPYQDKEVLPYSLSCADIGIVTLSQGAEMVSVPSKTYYTLAAGSVVLALASQDSELGLLIDKYDCGKVFENPIAEQVAAFITSLSQDAEKMQHYKQNARRASLDYTPRNALIYYDYICGEKSL